MTNIISNTNAIARIKKLPLIISVAVTGLLYELGDRRLFPEKGLLDLNEHSSHPIAGIVIGLTGGLLGEAYGLSRGVRNATTVVLAGTLATAVEFGALGPNTTDAKDVGYTLIGSIAALACIKKPGDDNVLHDAGAPQH